MDTDLQIHPKLFKNLANITGFQYDQYNSISLTDPHKLSSCEENSYQTMTAVDRGEVSKPTPSWASFASMKADGKFYKRFHRLPHCYCVPLYGLIMAKKAPSPHTAASAPHHFHHPLPF